MSGKTIEGTRGVQKGADSQGMLKVARGKYRFASDGGVAGTIDIQGDTLPAGAIVTGGFLDVTTPVTGPGASLGITLESAGDIVASAAISGAPWSTAGRKSIIPAMTGATAIKLTAARALGAVISAANLTAGDFDVVVYYLEPLP